MRCRRSITLREHVSSQKPIRFPAELEEPVRAKTNPTRANRSSSLRASFRVPESPFPIALPHSERSAERGKAAKTNSNDELLAAKCSSFLGAFELVFEVEPYIPFVDCLEEIRRGLKVLLPQDREI